ncbi:hypothetical protein [Aeromonas salmonicida]|uniref:hypothetical protein n=1 Tax=Aeromonas salmonicida TaxID=645 RepID=UPI001C5D112D|nr:hypothetical protein [Aeromonas salmonicida]
MSWYSAERHLAVEVVKTEISCAIMMAPGAAAPRVVNHDHIVRMKPGSAIVDMTQIRTKREAPHPYTSG